MGELPESLQVLFGAVFMVVMLLGWASRRRPDIAWLRKFDLSTALPEGQRRRLNRMITLNAGVQLILLGIALPIGYIFLTAMFFGDLTRRGLLLALVAGLVCIGLGVTAIAQTLRR